jgi:hypothetical protein
MIALQGDKTELRFTLEIVRAATGKVETFEMIGHSDPEELKKLLGAENGSNTLDSST